jgi:hypothetical protein
VFSTLADGKHADRARGICEIVRKIRRLQLISIVEAATRLQSGAAERVFMQLHSLVVSEPAGILTGFGAGLLTFHLANLCGMAPHSGLVWGCMVHFLANTLIAGHINLCLLDFLALALVRLPAAAGSSFWMSHYVNSGHLLW